MVFHIVPEVRHCMMDPSRGCTASMDCSSLQEGNNVCAPFYERWQLHRFQHYIVRSRSPLFDRGGMRTGERVILQGCALRLSEQRGRRSLEASDGKQRTVLTSLIYSLLYATRLKDAGLVSLRLMVKTDVLCLLHCQTSPLLSSPLASLLVTFFEISTTPMSSRLPSSLRTYIFSRSNRATALLGVVYSSPITRGIMRRAPHQVIIAGDQVPAVDRGISGRIRNSWIFRRPISSRERSHL